MCNRNYQFGPQHSWRGRGAGYYRRNFGSSFRSVPVNITETTTGFQLQLFAPGLNKTGIQVSVKDDILTVSYNVPDKQQEDPAIYTRREYRFESFERSFLLKSKVQTASITAVYQEGILTIQLPKNPDTNLPPKEVVIH